MNRDVDGAFKPTARARKQQEQDQRRMAYRRAIESYCEQRQLLQAIADYPDACEINLWQVTAVPLPKSAARSH
ncbi:hypothetical protein G7007_02105 [Pseudomonas entomophila]|jgi:hypothetical protein|uniref:PA3496 family putative envelope integrity protein n=1 Tax=Pseudomonas entomophila TaxID=312306 RepID=UPI0015E433F0|nr:hypothetical protein [Pseudomonas entomophila]MBA1191656.1 hypothetical protein [Pseudomonas entomophila]